MIIHVLDTALQVQPAGIHVVVDPVAPGLMEACDSYDITWLEQVGRSGAGHAVRRAVQAIPDDTDVLVLQGDTPLLEADVLQELIDAQSSGLKVLTTKIDEVSTGIFMAPRSLLAECLENMVSENFQKEYHLKQ